VLNYGLGTKEEYDSPNADVLKGDIENTKEFIRISHGVGG
jgi:hypothetical protein